KPYREEQIFGALEQWLAMRFVREPAFPSPPGGEGQGEGAASVQRSDVGPALPSPPWGEGQGEGAASVHRPRAATEHAAFPHPPHPNPLPTGEREKTRTLVVDDDPINRTIVCELLQG